jgi:hypothetical protein
MKKTVLLLVSAWLTLSVSAQTISTFESFSLSPNSELNGAGKPVHGSFTSGGITFPNTYQTAYGGYWSDGWAYSTKQDDTTAGYLNMYASYANGAYSGTKYAVAQSGSLLHLTNADTVKGLYVTNTTYAALSMLNGDAFTEKFGGASGNDPDYFYLTIKGFKQGAVTTDSVVFYLADYRFSDNAQDYIIKNWTWVDVSSLGSVDSLVFTLVTSDVGQFGPNTPLFFAVDDVTTTQATASFENLTLAANKYWNKPNASVFEDYVSGHGIFRGVYTTASWGDYWSKGFALSNHTDVELDSGTVNYTKMYTAVTGIGVDSSETYAMVQNKAMLRLTPEAQGKQLSGVYITNSNYAYLSMKWGDGFARKFNDSDFFALTVIGFKQGVKTDSVMAHLADSGRILTSWKWVDLTSLGDVDSIQFLLSSSDVGQFGMNTPGFFAIDNFTTRDFRTGMNEQLTSFEMSVYPNPTNTDVTIALPHDMSKANLRLLDVTGREIIAQPITNLTTIELGNVPAGMYFVEVSTASQKAVKRMVKY